MVLEFDSGRFERPSKAAKPFQSAPLIKNFQKKSTGNPPWWCFPAVMGWRRGGALRKAGAAEASKPVADFLYRV